MFKIKYCGSWNYKPQAESLSVDMNNAGLRTIFEEGDKGQFEIFKYGKGANFNSFIKAGHGTFITLSQVERKLAGMD